MNTSSAVGFESQRASVACPIGDRRPRGSTAPATRPIVRSTRQRSLRNGATVAVACFVEALVILGVVVTTLGIGSEGASSAGQDRLQPPTTNAPEPRPEPGLPENAIAPSAPARLDFLAAARS
jgi:hypothetical protein